MTFRTLEVQQIPRSEDAWINALSHLATSGAIDHDKRVFVEHLQTRSIEEPAVLQIKHEPSWMDPIDYLGTTPQSYPGSCDQAKNVMVWNLRREAL